MTHTYYSTACLRFAIITCFAGLAKYYGKSFATADEARSYCGKHDYFIDLDSPEKEAAPLQY